MKIKSIHLKNIRSYEDGRMEFPEGSILLSGDIGCGKSTILQSIEFALFGTGKDVSGPDLLRHGKNSGSVRVDFDLDGVNYVVERTLKRGKNISQDTCKLVTNNQPEEIMPVELKSRVLSLFGYPQEMLKKNKPLYRFTVYTPQEEMKRILVDEDDRLAILRSIFGVDKYGTIRNNSKMLLTELRRMRTGLDGELRTIETDTGRLAEVEDTRKVIQARLKEQEALFATTAEKAESKKSSLDFLKKSFLEINSARHDLARKEADLNAKKRRAGQIGLEIAESESRKMEYESEISKTSRENSTVLKNVLAEAESKRDMLISSKAVKNDSLRKMQKIHTEGRCDFCGQVVHNPAEYSRHIEEIRKRITSSDAEIGEIDTSIKRMKENISSAEKRDQYMRLISDIDSRRARLESELASIRRESALLENDVLALRTKTEGFEELQRRITQGEDELFSLQKSRSELERNVARYEQQAADAERRIKEIEEKAERAGKIRERADKISNLVTWFEPFNLLMENIEKHVMLTIQREFNEYFQKWFSMLMGEQLSVKIDERFAPIIEQNGYQTEYENLSGGEKTSVALAYRLALNRVINNMIDTIKTKDLMILDEPTDGFSTDQLDRIRDVINELGLKQIIVVSHEPKIDTYVDNVIRIYKENHVSRVAS